MFLTGVNRSTKSAALSVKIIKDANTVNNGITPDKRISLKSKVLYCVVLLYSSVNVRNTKRIGAKANIPYNGNQIKGRYGKNFMVVKAAIQSNVEVNINLIKWYGLF